MIVDGEKKYNGVEADVAVFYGFQPAMRRAMREYVAAGHHAIHIDLGYWSRRWRGSRYGYHRFSIDAHHPNAYFQRVRHPRDRADALGITLRTAGSYVLLCGMSEKAAGVCGYGFHEWERDAVKKIRAATRRMILFRPKPAKHANYQGLDGTRLAPARKLFDDEGYPIVDIVDAVRGAFCVVSHHSNAGMDAIVEGVPCFQLDGVAAPMGLSDLSMIEKPKLPTDEERQQWANDVAYTQFNCQEMRAGIPWRHFKEEGLIG
jgi:hypothetical protein